MPFIERSYYESGYVAADYFETTIEFVGIILPGFRRSEGDAFLLHANIKNEAGTPTTLYFSYNHPAPVVSGQGYNPIILSIGNLEKSIIDGSGGYGQRLISTLGSITLDMESGKNIPLTRMQWAGGGFTLFRGPKYGPASLQLAQFETIFQARFRDISYTDSEIVLQVADGSVDMEVPLERLGSVFTGADLRTGQNMPDLIGKSMPRTLGFVFNVPLTVIDWPRQIYSLNFLSAQVVNVYDNMNPYTFASSVPAGTLPTSNPAPGTYHFDVSGGMVRLGSVPAGKLSADIGGATFSLAIHHHMWLLIRDMLAAYAPFVQANLSQLEFENANYTGGIYLGPDVERTVADVLDFLCGSVGAYWFIDALSTLRVLHFEFRTPSGRIEDADMVSRSADPALPPSWKVRVKYKKNYNVHDKQDLQNPNLTTAVRSFALNEWRQTERTDQTIRQNRSDARIHIVETAINEPADALDLANRLFDLYSVPRRIYRITLEDRNFLYHAGETITLDSFRLDANEKPTIVVRINELLSQRRTELTLWG